MSKENSAGGAELLPAQTVNISDVRLHEVEGEPRVRDTDIGKRLGFARPRDIRPLIEKHRAALEAFGAVQRRANAVASGKGRRQAVDEIWLNEAQAIYIGAKSDAPNAPAVLTMLINVFMAWRRGHLPAVGTAALAPDVLEMMRRDDGMTKMLAKKVTGIEASVAAIVNALANIGDRIVATSATTGLVRYGMTAGQIWRVHGFPPIRAAASWFGNRLTEMGCSMPGKAQMGDHSARLYDPDKAAHWLKNGGGRALVEGYVKERLGQGKLEGV